MSEEGMKNKEKDWTGKKVVGIDLYKGLTGSDVPFPVYLAINLQTKSIIMNWFPFDSSPPKDVFWFCAKPLYSEDANCLIRNVLQLLNLDFPVSPIEDKEAQSMLCEKVNKVVREYCQDLDSIFGVVGYESPTMLPPN